MKKYSTADGFVDKSVLLKCEEQFCLKQTEK